MLFQVTIQQDQLFDTYLSHRKAEVDRNLNKLGTTPDRTEYVLLLLQIQDNKQPKLP